MPTTFLINGGKTMRQELVRSKSPTSPKNPMPDELIADDAAYCVISCQRKNASAAKSGY